MKLFYPNKNNDRLWLWYIKLTICSSLQFIFTVLFIVYAVFTADTFKEFGWAINDVNSQITITAQETRLWMVLFMSLFIFCSCYNIYGLLRLRKDRLMILSLGIFTWVLLPYFIYVSVVQGLFGSFWTYLNTRRFASETIDHRGLFDWIRKKAYSTSAVRNTIFYYVALLVFLASTIFAFIPDQYPPKVVNDTFVFHSLSYFTKLTNIGCFVFLVSYGYFHNKLMNDGNKLGIYMATYISVVGLVYWIALFPVVIIDGSFAQSSFFDKFNDIWWHGLSPIVFTAFIFCSMSISRDRPEFAYGNQWCVLMAYPLWYSMWAYISPFFARVSVYGFLTNCNPHMIRFSLVNGDVIQDGKPYYILFILAFGLLFTIFFTVYRRFNILMVRNRTLNLHA